MTVRFVVAGQSRERGSVLLLVLMVCLGLALVIQAMAAVAVCAERALADEISGRTRMSEKDGALAAVRQRMLSGWEVFDWQVVESGDRPVEGTVGLLETSDWVMQARVRQNPSSLEDHRFCLAGARPRWHRPAACAGCCRIAFGRARSRNTLVVAGL